MVREKRQKVHLSQRLSRCQGERVDSIKNPTFTIRQFTPVYWMSGTGWYWAVFKEGKKRSHKVSCTSETILADSEMMYFQRCWYFPWLHSNCKVYPCIELFIRALCFLLVATKAFYVCYSITSGTKLSGLLWQHMLVHPVVRNCCWQALFWLRQSLKSFCWCSFLASIMSGCDTVAGRKCMWDECG